MSRGANFASLSSLLNLCIRALPPYRVAVPGVDYIRSYPDKPDGEYTYTGRWNVFGEYELSRNGVFHQVIYYVLQRAPFLEDRPLHPGPGTAPDYLQHSFEFGLAAEILGDGV